jgi:hypothetical protein
VERGVRAGAGLLLLVFALSILFYGVMRMRQRDYLGCIVLTFTGLALVRAGVEVLRSSTGE